MKTKTKVTAFQVYPISSWGVSKYGVTLIVNPTSFPFFDTGCSLDVEDDEQGNFVGCGIYNPSDNTCYYWSEFEQFKAVELSKFVAHNGISDLRKLQKWGFKIDNTWLLWDTQLMAHIADSSRRAYGLKKLVKEDLGMEYPSYEDITGKKNTKHHVTLKDVPVDLVSEYNAMDCYTTYKLYVKQLFVYEPCREVSYFHEIEQPCSFILDKMTQKGVKVDLNYLNELKLKLEASQTAVKGPILNELGEINLDSPRQLLQALNLKGVNPVFRGKPSLDQRGTLYTIYGTNPLVDHLKRYSEVSTLLSNFVYPYLERGEEIVRAQFRQTGTRTGRLSCSNPNLLQIPRRTTNGKLVRRMFVARPGCLFGDLDFGQIEPRVLAHLSQDKVLCQMFNDGVDFHTFTAERLNLPRERAKVLNLSVSYRATYKSVSQQLKVSWNEAQKEIDMWWSLFPELYDWQQKLIHQSKKEGYFTTLFGRRIKVEDLDSPSEFRKEAAQRQLLNNIAQGSAAEIMKKAMINIDKANISMLIQVYDELLIEEPEEAVQSITEEAVSLMENCVELTVPLTVDAAIGASWEECKS